MDKKKLSLLLLIESFVTTAEEKRIEKSNSNPKIVPFGSNHTSNYFRCQLETIINSQNKFNKYRENKNYNTSIENFQKITNRIDNLLNEINLYSNHQNKVSQPI
ncbi:MAG: hypothetical protein WC389_08455 [Lutibacter sp.]